ncbi:MAG TPA: serine kinase [Chloroflexi bacterium]|nr:serine kinase [Chloroflexota bacterium]
MATVKKIAEELGLVVLAGAAETDHEVKGGYIADLLSCVMAGAQPDQLWFTLQTHLNIVAVASLLGIAAIVVTEGAVIPQETIDKAEQEGIPLLLGTDPTFETVVKLAKSGLL